MRLKEERCFLTLTSNAFKILESFIRDSISSHLKTNCILSNKQFCFLAGKSTLGHRAIFLSAVFYDEIMVYKTS